MLCPGNYVFVTHFDSQGLYRDPMYMFVLAQQLWLWITAMSVTNINCVTYAVVTPYLSPSSSFFAREKGGGRGKELVQSLNDELQGRMMIGVGN